MVERRVHETIRALWESLLGVVDPVGAQADDAAASGLDFGALEDRILMSASPLMAEAPAASADVEPDAHAALTETLSLDAWDSGGPVAVAPMGSNDATTADGDDATSADWLGLQPGSAAGQAALEEADETSESALDGAANPLAADADDACDELVLVDSSIADYEGLLDDLLAHAGSERRVEVVVFDGAADGVEQVGEILARYDELDAVHFLSHGNTSGIVLGRSVLNAGTLDDHAAAISGWQASLADGADLLFYSCDAAATAQGQAMLAAIRELTGADVAASDDASGHTTAGGNWLLEHTLGSVETPTIFPAGGDGHWTGQLDANAPVANDDAYTMDEDGVLTVERGVNGPTSGLIGWWQLEDGAGNTAADSSAAGHDGTLGSGAGADASDPTWSGPGATADGALRFDGVNDYVSTGSYELQTANEFTISVWFQTDTTTGAHHIVWQGVEGQNGWGNGTGTPATAEMHLSVGRFDANNKIAFFLGQGDEGAGADSIDILSAHDFTDTAGWHQAVVVVTDLGGGVLGAQLYVDGVLEGVDSGAQNDRSMWNTGLRLGQPGVGSRTFDGQIDEVRVYDRAISENEVATLWRAGVLANDSDADQVALSAVLVAGPAHGDLTFNADGTFTYSPDADWHGTDSFTYKANDGAADSNVATVTITVNPVNDAAPVLDLDANDSAGQGGADYGNTFTEGGGAVRVADSDATLRDVDGGNLESLTATITNLKDGAAESLAGDTSGTSITASFDSGTGVLSLTGADTVAHYEQVLRSIVYNNTSDAPDTTARVITFVAHDGTAAGNTGTTALTMTAVNDAPAIDLDANNSSGAAGANFQTSFTEGGGAVAIVDGDATIHDADNATLQSLTLTITNLHYGANESLVANTAETSISASYDVGTGVLTLSGTDSIAHYQQVLRTVTYNNTHQNSNATARTITFVASDGVTVSNTGTATVSLAGTNDAPVLDLDANDSAGRPGNDFTATFVEDDGPVLLADADARLNDADDAQLTHLYVVIQNLRDGADESLAADTSDTNITASYDPDTGMLTLAGADTVAHYQQVLRTITYENTSQSLDTTARVVTFTAYDGSNFSDIGTTTVNMTAGSDAPTLDLDADNSAGAAGANFRATFTEDGGPVAVSDIDAVLTDVDSGALASLTATITNLRDGAAESLAANTAGTGISASYNATTGVLTLSGADTVAHYQQVLRTITYNNASQAPDTADRVITFAADDGTNLSNVGTTTLTIDGGNDAPTIWLPAAATVDEDTPLVFTVGQAGLITVGDADVGGGLVEVSLSAGQGSLTLGGTAGLAFSVGDGTADEAMAFAGTLAEVNAALDGLRFTPGGDYHGPASVAISVDDQGGAEPTSGSVAVTVQPANDAPAAGSAAYTTDAITAISVNGPGLLGQSNDADGDSLSALVVAGPAHGTLALNADGSFVYTPDPAYYGADSFQYAVSDGQARSGPATVALTVVSLPPPVVPTNPTNPTDGTGDSGTTPTDSTGDTTTDSGETSQESDEIDSSATDSGEPAVAPPAEAETGTGVAGHGRQVAQNSQTETATREGDAASTAAAAAEKIAFDLWQASDFTPATSITEVDEQAEIDNELRRLSAPARPEGPAQTGATLIRQVDRESEDVAARELLSQLDTLADELHRETRQTTLTVATAAGVSAAVSVGYAMWALRSSYLVASVLAATPAWRMIDPIPILAFSDLEQARKRGDKESPQDKVESLFQNASLLGP